jgi:serine protease
VGVTGVAYNAKILPVRVLGRCGGLLSDVASAIIWASGAPVDALDFDQ